MDTAQQPRTVVEFPARSRAGATELLSSVRARVGTRVGKVVATVLEKVDDALFDFVQQATLGTDHHDYLDAMREFRLRRQDIESAVQEHVARCFDALATGRPLSVEDVVQDRSQATELELVSEDELEERLGAGVLAQSIHKDFGAVLSQIERRLGAVAGDIVLNDDNNPMGAGQLGAAILVGLRTCETTPRVKLIVFKMYERELRMACGALFDETNRMLVDAGILPQMRAVRLPRAPGAPRPQAPSADDQGAPGQEHAQGWVQEGPAGGGYGGGYSAGGPVGYAGTGGGHGAATQHRAGAYHGGHGAPGGPAAHSMAGEGPQFEQVPHEGATFAEHSVFSTLHDLLNAYRAANPQTAAEVQHSEQARPLSSEETLSLLQHLQQALPDGVRRAIEDRSQSLAARLKQEMLQALGHLGLDASQAKLSPNDEDAVDLVGMLFEVLLDERDLDSSVRDTIGQLIVPFIKVALMDRRMFMQRSHPARRLLNSLAEACEGNRGETPQERALLDKVRETVDRLLSEFNENVAIFEMLEEEFRAFIEQHRRRVELAERRAAEAQRGRERLEQARALAEAEIEARVAGRQVPPTADSVLRRYWAHHLTVTALRDGHESDKFRTAVATGTAVIGALDAALVGETLLLPALAPMRAALLQILATSGCVGDSAKDVVRAVADELRGLSRGEASDTVDPAVAAAEPPALTAEPPRTENIPGLELSSDPEELDFAAEDAERIAQLAVGTWVEFTGPDGSCQPAKLSWVSPISRRLLFVNRRGIRFCVASAEELAAMMRAGHLLIRQVDTAFEAAMHQVLGKLGADDEGLTADQFAA